MEDKIRKIMDESTDYQTGEVDAEIAISKLLDLFSVSESSLEDRLYNKCLEGMPDITKEEFEGALNTWLHQYTKSKQIENFNPYSR